MMSSKMLVGDDEQSITEVVRNYVVRYFPNIAVDEVHNPSILVDRARQVKFGLILTDHNYGQQMTGVDAIKKIRLFDPVVPIYMLSASDVRKEALKAGATGYIDKALSLSKELSEIIKRHFA